MIKEMAYIRFGKRNAVNMDINTYKNDIDMLALHRLTNFAESLLVKHVNSPYLTVDELIGEIQLQFLNDWGQLKKYRPLLKSVTVDKLIDFHNGQLKEGDEYVLELDNRNL